MDSLLLIGAFVCFLIACLVGTVAAGSKVAGFNWVALGLALWVLTLITS